MQSTSSLPAVLTTTKVSQVLGISEEGVRVLASRRELKPLGNPASNAPKYFARCDIENLAQDKQWLHKAIKIISTEWKKKNDARKSKRRVESELVAV